VTSKYDLKPLTLVCEVLSGGTPRTTVPAFWNGNIPWASVKDFNIDSRWFTKTEKSISQLGLDSCSSVLLEPGDLVISARGTVGAVGQCKMRTSFNQSNYGLRAKSGLTKNDYLYYALSYAKRALIGDTHGGMFDTITRDTLDRLLIPVPTLNVQEQIAEILGSLDMKIAVNKAVSKTLEDIAQTIFKSWFIDFDPVKAKIAGEKPVGMDDATAALFPESIEESEIGLIPKGWEVRALDEISDYLNGLAMQKFPVIDENEQIPVIKIAQLRAGNSKGADMASSLLEPKFIIKDGDILFSWSGTLEVENWAGGPGALNQHLFKVTGKNVPDWYSYLSTKSFLPFFRGIASGKATTMGHIQRGHLTESKLAIPNLELMNRATEIIEPIIALKTKTSVESRHLAEVRDSLLPRLISGELQIPEEMLAS
jgi:type I restriction enzyme S subunit